MRNLIFVGLPGSGKSTVGRLAARTLGLPFVAADTALAQAEGRSIPDIFADGGESYFRTLETRVLTDLCRREGMVLATGGGAVLRRENRTLLKGSGLVIFLDRSPWAIRRTLRSLYLAAAHHAVNKPTARQAAEEAVRLWREEQQ